MQEIPVDNVENPLIAHLAKAGIDWMQACGQKGRCTTCLFEVLEGAENLLPPTEAEMRYLASGRLRQNQRLACQACTSGNLLISVPAFGQLPHLEYAE